METAAPPTPSRLGVLLRILIFAVIAIAGLTLIGPLFSPLGYLLTAVLSTFTAAAIANSICLKIYERAHLADIGLYWTAASRRNLVTGLIGGIGAASLVLAPPLLVGAAQLKTVEGPAPSWGALGFVSVVLVFGALGEEVLFRGYAFQVLVPALGAWATVLPTGALFGLAHSFNESSTWLSIANTVGWGVLLGAAVLRSGDLWLAVGIHYGWNWALPLYGVNVSGFNIRVTGYAMQWRVGELWSGGDYGPEAGLLCTLVLGVLIVYLWKAPIVRQVLPLTQRRTESSL